MKIFATLRIEKDKKIIHAANVNSTMATLGREVAIEDTALGLAGEFHPLKDSYIPRADVVQTKT